MSVPKTVLAEMAGVDESEVRCDNCGRGDTGILVDCHMWGAVVAGGGFCSMWCKREEIGMSELKPCPFCGNKYLSLVKHEAKYGWRPFYYVLCDYGEGGCGSSGQWNHEEAEAIEAWNRRANDERLD